MVSRNPLLLALGLSTTCLFTGMLTRPFFTTSAQVTDTILPVSTVVRLPLPSWVFLQSLVPSPDCLIFPTECTIVCIAAGLLVTGESVCTHCCHNVQHRQSMKTSNQSNVWKTFCVFYVGNHTKNFSSTEKSTHNAELQQNTHTLKARRTIALLS